MLRTYTCPHCGANLTVEYGKLRTVCEYCDSEIYIEDMHRNKVGEAEDKIRQHKEERAYREEEPRTNTETAFNNPGAGLRTDVSPRNRTVALILLIFIGIFGAHRFYVGKIGTGILYFCTAAFCGVGWIVDLVLIILGYFRDAEGRPVLNWQ